MPDGFGKPPSAEVFTPPVEAQRSPEISATPEKPAQAPVTRVEKSAALQPRQDAALETIEVVSPFQMLQRKLAQYQKTLERTDISPERRTRVEGLIAKTQQEIAAAAIPESAAEPTVAPEQQPITSQREASALFKAAAEQIAAKKSENPLEAARAKIDSLKNKKAELEQQIAQKVGGVYTRSDEMVALSPRINGAESVLRAALTGENADVEGPKRAAELAELITKYNAAAEAHLNSYKSAEAAGARADETVAQATAAKNVAEKAAAQNAEAEGLAQEVQDLAAHDSVDLMVDKKDLEKQLAAAGLTNSNEVALAVTAFKNVTETAGLSAYARNVAHAKFIIAAKKALAAAAAAQQKTGS